MVERAGGGVEVEVEVVMEMEIEGCDSERRVVFLAPPHLCQRHL